MYSFTTNVRYSEVDENYQLTTSALMDYLQDCAVAHTQTTSQNLAHLATLNRAWFVGSWNIEILSRPKISDPLIVSTWATDLHGFFARRNFTISTPEGTPYVKADSTWLYVDLSTTKPLRPEPQDWEPYFDANDEPLTMAHPMQRRLNFTSPADKSLVLPVESHMLDSNHHVNNAQYIDLALLVSEFDMPSHIEVQYRQQATLGDTLVVDVHEIPNGYGVNIHDPEGAVFALVQLDCS